MVKSLFYEDYIDPITDYPLLIRATFVALKNLDGKADIHKLQAEVVSLLNLTSKQIERKNNPSNLLSEFEYRTKIARTYLKEYGAIDNFGDEWFITEDFSNRGIFEEEAEYIFSISGHEVNEEEIEVSDKFKEKLLNTIQEMDPYNFEPLVREILIRSGFKNCQLTPKNNDGGIDITAKLPVLGKMSIPVVVQCKKYFNDEKGEEYKVSIEEMNAFIGANKPSGAIMIYVTSNIFTQYALERAEQANVITIDKDPLIDLLIKHKIGCYYDDKKKEYRINYEFFESLNEIKRE